MVQSPQCDFWPTCSGDSFSLFWLGSRCWLSCQPQQADCQPDLVISESTTVRSLPTSCMEHSPVHCVVKQLRITCNCGNVSEIDHSYFRRASLETNCVTTQRHWVLCRLEHSFTPLFCKRSNFALLSCVYKLRDLALLNCVYKLRDWALLSCVYKLRDLALLSCVYKLSNFALLSLIQQTQKLSFTYFPL